MKLGALILILAVILGGLVGGLVGDDPGYVLLAYGDSALEERRIGLEDACGRVPLSGLLVAARAHGLTARTVDLRNSGDTAGPRNQVVGYGAYIVA